jgi:hypothetical protein
MMMTGSFSVTRPMSRGEALGLKIMGRVRSDVDGRLKEQQYPPANELDEIKAHFKDLCVPGAPMVPLYILSQDPTVLWQQMPAIALAVDQVQRFEHQGSMHATGELLRFMVEDCGNDVNASHYTTFDHNNGVAVRGTLLSRALALGVDGALAMRHLLRLGANVNQPFEFYDAQQLQALNGHSLLHVAFTMQCPGLAQVLLEHGARFSQTVDPPGAMAHAMQYNACVEMIELCVNFKQQLTMRDVAAEGMPYGTPLHRFAVCGPGRHEFGIRGVLSMLIDDLRISPHLVDAQGRTAKDWAEASLRNLSDLPQIDHGVLLNAHEMVRILNTSMQLETSRGMSVAAVQALRSNDVGLSVDLQRRVYGQLQNRGLDVLLGVGKYTPDFMRNYNSVVNLEKKARQAVADRHMHQ